MTTVEHAAFASPLDLLAQWRSDLPDGPPLRELLILGYTPGFRSCVDRLVR